MVLEQPVDLMRKATRPSPPAILPETAFSAEDIEGQHRHVARHVDGFVGVFVALGEGLRGFSAWRARSRGCCVGVEDRRQSPFLARTAPDLAFPNRGQPPIDAGSGPQDLLGAPSHLVVFDIVDEQRGRIEGPEIVGDHKAENPTEAGGNRDPRLVVGGLSPQFERGSCLMMRSICKVEGERGLPGSWGGRHGG